MSILVDHQIRTLCVDPPRGQFPLLDPFIEGEQEGGIISRGLSHAGYDLRLGGNRIRIFKNSFNEIISPKRFRSSPTYEARLFDDILHIPEHEAIIIPPHGYILGYTLEMIRMPEDLKAFCVGKSTLARCGVLVNTTPAEPGWHGHLTLEIANITPCPLEIYVGEGIAQIEFMRLDALPERSYQYKADGKPGKYQNQGPEPIVARTKV